MPAVSSGPRVSRTSIDAQSHRVLVVTDGSATYRFRDDLGLRVFTARDGVLVRQAKVTHRFSGSASLQWASN